jgi:hypothetical protein
MYKIPFNLRFKIDAKVFSFVPNFINKSCRVSNLVSNKISFAIFGFFLVFYEFCKAATYTHEITDLLGGGGLGHFALGSLEKRRAPARPQHQLAVRSWRVLAGGKEPVGQGLRNLGNAVEVNAHDRQQWNGVNDGEVRRPWRRVAVPGKGPANRRS